MKISININVRNPEWYWTEEELLESKKLDAIMGRKEWEMLHSDIPKHIEENSFDYKFEVKNYAYNPNTNYDLTIYSSNKELKHNIIINDVTIIAFIGDDKKSYVVVSNEIIHQYFNQKPREDGYEYFYFYIKENIECFKLRENIWVSEKQMDKIQEELGNANIEIEEDLNINIKNLMFMRKTRHQAWDKF